MVERRVEGRTKRGTGKRKWRLPLPALPQGFRFFLLISALPRPLPLPRDFVFFSSYLPSPSPPNPLQSKLENCSHKKSWESLTDWLLCDLWICCLQRGHQRTDSIKVKLNTCYGVFDTIAMETYKVIVNKLSEFISITTAMENIT